MRRVSSYVATAFAALVMGCASLPPLEGGVGSVARTDTDGTRLARVLAGDLAARPGLSGIHPLPEPRDAFATRVLLAAAAEKSIDAQYYIWHGDDAGMLPIEWLL